MASSPESLYDPVVMRHARAPSRRGAVEAATRRADGKNRPCGDTVRLSLTVDSADIIAAIRFDAEGCALCLAAASALCDAVEGRTVEGALGVVARFVKMIDEGGDADDVGDLAALGKVHAFPGRRGCATLAAEVLKRAVEGC